MLKNRSYEPNDGDVLYHYCKPETFLAIISNKKLRFSDLYSMNDFMELEWGRQVWRESKTDLIETCGEPLVHDIGECMQAAWIAGYPLATCLSTQGDVLSQWRAYAQDGRGYAIGFDAKRLVNLGARALRVTYDKEEQQAEIRGLVNAMYEVEKNGEPRDPQGFLHLCTGLAFDMAAFKSPAFSEEREVRLMRLANLTNGDRMFRLSDDFGPADDPDWYRAKVEFHLKESAPVPHLDIDFSRKNVNGAIVEVILGPKNSSLEVSVAAFLETNYIQDVKISRSIASYR
ncbi:hypothetical protein PCO31110_00062 [Pandoraea communis]|uniref:DUF2971 domain-containing protein n=1 Tax=Pandoraea communis TaxID=2508297 RepID=A0A5E4RAL9_9BURK|nr:DUF2971 domain-containing protein [Pandoraea communis]VVD60237.1 hypothetical protein PCO31110_00062 [Pandoraea communis]